MYVSSVATAIAHEIRTRRNRGILCGRRALMSLRKVAVFACVAAVASAALPATKVRASAGANKSLFVGVTDESGKPVTDLTVNDILIREEGADRVVKEVKPASQPISVVFLVDTAMDMRVKDAYGTPDSWIRDMRDSAAAFAREL